MTDTWQATGAGNGQRETRELKRLIPQIVLPTPNRTPGQSLAKFQQHWLALIELVHSTAKRISHNVILMPPGHPRASSSAEKSSDSNCCRPPFSSTSFTSFFEAAQRAEARASQTSLAPHRLPASAVAPGSSAPSVHVIAASLETDKSDFRTQMCDSLSMRSTVKVRSVTTCTTSVGAHTHNPARW